MEDFSSNPFITTSTFKLDDYAKRIPWLVGINSEEGAMVSSYLYSDDGIKLLEWTNKLPEYTGYDHLSDSDRDEITAAIESFYFNGSINLAKVENVTNVSSILSYI
jgi:hypothetical protein